MPDALDGDIVVAGHKRPDAADNDPETILGSTKTYIRDLPPYRAPSATIGSTFDHG